MDPYYQRHDQAAREALKKLKDFASQVNAPASSVVEALESFGWIKNGTVKGIRMFTLPSEGDINEANRDLKRRGVRANETLKVRGEGFLDGSWKVDDIVGTIRSFGARAVFDARFDGVASYEVAQLSKNNRLLHLKMKGIPPVSDTDVCLISTTATEDDTAYILSTSCDSHLVPDSGFRTKIDLQGFALRRLEKAPEWDTIVMNDVDQSALSRPSHRRNQSSASIGLLTPQTLSGQTSIRSASNSLSTPAGTPFLSIPILPISKKPTTFPLYTLKSSTPDVESSTRPGVHISLIVLASPSVNLPASYSADLATKIPLSLASLNRYLSISGFAPYIVRKEPRIQLDVLEENFNAEEMKFRVVFRVHSTLRDDKTRIRFFGLGFGNGRFEVKVTRARGWSIEYDVEPEREPEIIWTETGGGGGGGGGEGDEFTRAASRKTVLSVLNSTATTRLDYFQRNPLPSSTSSYIDPALLSGPRGGMTIVIPNDLIAGGPPVVLSITKSSSKTAAPIATMKSTSRALGRASKSVGEDRQNESIEEMLRSGTAEGRAESALKGTREVLNLLRLARAQEKAEMEEI